MTRDLVKRIISILFLFLAYPLYAACRLSKSVADSERVFQECSQLISLFPGLMGSYLRGGFYFLTCPDVCRDVSVGFLTIFSHENTSIGSGVYIGAHCNIGMCFIGSNCLLGSGVHVLSGNRQHDFTSTAVPIKDQERVFRKISIGEDCWVGNNAVIMADVGKHCVVAAGSVVIEPVSDYSIVGGNPARHIRSRLHDSKVGRNG